MLLSDVRPDRREKEARSCCARPVTTHVYPPITSVAARLLVTGGAGGSDLIGGGAVPVDRQATMVVRVCPLGTIKGSTRDRLSATRPPPLEVCTTGVMSTLRAMSAPHDRHTETALRISYRTERARPHTH